MNEEFNVPELAARVLDVFETGALRGELVLVDDGSTDGTAAAIRRLEAAHPGVVVGVYHPKNLGIAAGWKNAATVARGAIVATIDADLQYQPEDLLRLRRALYEHSVDVVQGWRSAVARHKDRRFYLSRGLNTLLNGTFGMRLRDNKSGFVMCAREVFLDLLSYSKSYFYWQSFIMVAAHAKGYSYREIETLFEGRKQGVSFLDKLDLPAATFDRVVCTEVLEHAVDPDAILRTIARILRPRGVAVITVPNDPLVLRLKAIVRRTPAGRLLGDRVDWGGDAYHLHQWTPDAFEALLGKHFDVRERACAPVDALPIRVCFRCTAKIEA